MKGAVKSDYELLPKAPESEEDVGGRRRAA